jgi:hypothetical protein
MVIRLKALRAGTAIAVAALVLAAVAYAAGHAVRLNLQGGYANKTLSACGNRHHYTFYHPGRSVPFNGTVAPAPPKPWRVKVKVKKCVAGRFVVVRAPHFAGHSGGRFHGSLRPFRRGFFFARAYYYGDRPAARSDKQYFRVR